MKKIKITKNDKVLSMDFHANLLKEDLLYKICKEFGLVDIYMDIYDVDTQESDFINKLVDKNNDLKITLTDCGGFAIKTIVEEIPLVISSLPKTFIGEINIWDCYTEWKDYLLSKTEKVPFFTFRRFEIEDNSNFYLNFNFLEGQTVEIICNLKYYNIDLIENLQNLIK